MSSNKGVVVVHGFTGSQGGAVAATLIKDGYTVRALTRDPTSERAIAAAKKLGGNVELVKGDNTKLETLVKAYTGANAVFAVTAETETEAQEALNIAQAAHDARVPHLVWSTLPSITLETNGRISNADNWDRKYRADEKMRELGVPVTFVRLGFFFENYITFNSVKVNDEGVVELTQVGLKGETKVPNIYLQKDFGRIVSSIITHFNQPDLQLNGRYVHIGHGPDDVAASTIGQTKEVERITGKKVILHEVSWPELQPMYDFCNNYAETFWACYANDKKFIKEKLGVKLSSFEEFVNEVLFPRH